MEPAFGKELAAKIASHLKAGLTIAYHHPYYCGMGLCYKNGKFCYSEVHDGEILSYQALIQFKANPECLEFSDQEAFEAWFAAQSAASLRGDNNQRITPDRLNQALLYCMNNPVENWAKYGG